MNADELFGERRSFSEGRLGDLRTRLQHHPHAQALPDLSIFAAGSYGRLEASPHSDIDLFFIYKGEPDSIESRKTSELRLFGSLIGIADDMGFPTFSNDGQYLRTVESKDLLRELGSATDDALNYFTLRMLMILESRPVFQNQAYEEILYSIFDSYYRDYPDHEASFEPWFLLNDIERFWKTLLLNYENKRNQNGPDTDKNKQKVRNFKLKFSRMTTCFATVAALGARPKPVGIDDLMALVKLTPRERLLSAQDHVPAAAPHVDALLSDYAWFMEQTALTEEELRSHFADRSSRSEMFERANSYGDKMFDLIAAIDQAGRADGHGSLLKYLVI